MKNIVYFQQCIFAVRSGVTPRLSRCCALEFNNSSSARSTLSSAICAAAPFARSSLNCSAVTRAIRQIVSCRSESPGARTSSYERSRFAHSFRALDRASTGPSSAVLTWNRSALIKAHCINKHCLARMKFSLSADHFCQYGNPIAITSASMAPMTCIHPDHSDLVMHVPHQSTQNKQYSGCGFAATAASAKAFTNWFASTASLLSREGSKA